MDGIEIEVEKKPESGGAPEIPLPKGFAPPEDSKEGEEVTALVKLKIMPNGMAKLCSIEGAPYEGYKDEPDMEEEKEEAVETPEGASEGNSEESNPSMGEGGGLADRIKQLRNKLKGMK